MKTKKKKYYRLVKRIDGVEAFVWILGALWVILSLFGWLWGIFILDFDEGFLISLFIITAIINSFIVMVLTASFMEKELKVIVKRKEIIMVEEDRK